MKRVCRFFIILSVLLVLAGCAVPVDTSDEEVEIETVEKIDYDIKTIDDEASISAVDIKNYYQYIIDVTNKCPIVATAVPPIISKGFHIR